MSGADIVTTDGAAAALVAKLAARKAPPRHADGIYFNLDEETYHADLALGSSDMNKLAYDPTAYWFESGHNPEREERERTDAKTRGTAVHVFVLYGRGEFERRYAPRYCNGSTREGRAENKQIAEAGKIGLPVDIYKRITQSAGMIAADPYISRAFSGGRAEVSVFWTRDGIRRKCRLDYLKKRSTVDLKSITNSRRINFRKACLYAIGEWTYLVQAEHYREGRDAMPGLIKAGAVHGNYNLAWLTRVAAEVAWAWVWCFWQAGGPQVAPLTKTFSVSPGNFEARDEGRVLLSLAEDNYRQFVKTFGLDTPWVVSEPVEELDINEIPGFFRRVK